jgi:hypothetical protein
VYPGKAPQKETFFDSLSRYLQLRLTFDKFTIKALVIGQIYYRYIVDIRFAPILAGKEKYVNLKRKCFMAVSI